MFKKFITWLYERYVLDDDIMEMIAEAEHVYMQIDNHEEAVTAMREKYFIERYGQRVDH